MFGLMSLGISVDGGGGGSYVGGSGYVSGSGTSASGSTSAGTSSGVSSFGPWGEGVYTPLDYPATRFLNESETLDDNKSQVSGLKSQVPVLLVIGLLLWALSK